MTWYIHNYIHWKNNQYWLNGTKQPDVDATTTEDILLQFYQLHCLKYTKFFKMDVLSKCAYLCSEIVVPKTAQPPAERIATILYSGEGCLDVDKKFKTSIANIASPALFVYTLPNIMLGEVCIRHGFKGEQLCTLAPLPDAEILQSQVAYLSKHQQTDACLVGHIDVSANSIKATMCWISQKPSEHILNTANLNTLFTLLQ